jgi:hypothetical protein
VTYEIVPAELAVKAMRDSGYKNAAYAIAELIDNSIQAGATEVQLLCAEEERVVQVRRRTAIHKVAVLDNGEGMSSATLRRALQYGNGSHLQDRSGIGRFGMGLPNSSLSQAARVEVWTWQKGGRPIYSYLDLKEINEGAIREVPIPVEKEIPRLWLDAGGSLGASGTLVVWSHLDRCQWRTARAIISNSEFLIGRIYRRFIHSGRAAIRMAAFEASQPTRFSIDKQAQANDPMYLMEQTSCPEPWGSVPMFEPWGTPFEHVLRVDGKDHRVRIRFSIAKKEAREGFNPGSRGHGQHAAQNVGVSVVRADRELELQLAWTTRHDPRERWWGAEIEFSPELDEVFGVTNDKQSARALADLALIETDEIAVREGFSSIQELMDDWRENGDPRMILLQVKQALDSSLSVMRNQLRDQTARRSKRDRHPDPSSAEARGTEATRQRQAEGHRGESDAGESLPTGDRQLELESELRELGLDEQDATIRAVDIIAEGRKYEFVHASLDSDAFFSVRPRGGAIIISINTDHSAYQHLVALLENPVNESDVEAVRLRMSRSYEGLKLLLEAWARYEDELPSALKDRARQARADWGRVARQFLTQD